MENLYIQIDENGNTINHPAFESNLIQAFGGIPKGWEPFNRTRKPTLSVYQILNSEHPTYQKLNGMWQDVWDFRDMTEEEKNSLQQRTKDEWNSKPYASNWSSWIFNEETCSYNPPVLYPGDGKQYFWQGSTNSWVEPPQYPEDGNSYAFNFDEWKWDLIPT